ncbi:MAG: hypothetical protein HY975_04445 [Candidatus Kerfeldbacteria bacterium]|nr:hypothetical protein [Candidatus Kerfeldbacteria bacterium]
MARVVITESEKEALRTIITTPNLTSKQHRELTEPLRHDARAVARCLTGNQFPNGCVHPQARHRRYATDLRREVTDTPAVTPTAPEPEFQTV